MERLWAPWRMEYIEQIDGADKGCIFCGKSSQNEDEKNLILYRGKAVFILLNAFPYTNGHLLAAPYRHVGDITDLRAEETQELMGAATLGVRVLRKAMHPDGFNIGLNLGRSAGAGIVDHVHLHIVPRWGGDTNFMGVCGGVKVIPEALSETLKKLRQVLELLEKKDV